MATYIHVNDYCLFLRMRNHGEVFTINKIIESIKSFPAADVAPVVHAHWNVFDRDEEDYPYAWSCSRCDEPYVFEEGEPLDHCYHYCPNCGAKMDKKEGGHE